MVKTSSAPAKAILVGEHAVVYGQPAIALPLSQLRACVEARESSQPLRVSSSYAGRPPFYWCKEDFQSTDPIKQVIALTARYFALASLQGELIIRSDIPVAGGLGSGAAVSAALARGLARLLNQEIPRDVLNSIVFEVEQLHHGAPSGIDNTVIVYEKPVYYVKDRPSDFIGISRAFTLVVADTGVSAPTRATVADVRAQLERQPGRTYAIFEQIGALVERSRSAIESGDYRQLGRLMTRNHALLQALDVSSALLDRLVAAALRGGACGAKLSGGGRGGNMIALARPESAASVQDELRRAGAKRVFVSSVGGESIAQ